MHLSKNHHIQNQNTSPNNSTNRRLRMNFFLSVANPVTRFFFSREPGGSKPGGNPRPWLSPNPSAPCDADALAPIRSDMQRSLSMALLQLNCGAHGNKQPNMLMAFRL